MPLADAAPTSATDERPMKKVKSVLQRTRSISCTAIAKEVGIPPASVYRILTNSLGKRKVCSHMCSTMTKEPCVFFLQPPICSV